MSKAIEFTYVNTIPQGLKDYRIKSGEVHKTAMKKIGIQLLTNIVTKAPTPPIMTGLLRSSGSVFYENEFIGTTPQLVKGAYVSAFNSGENTLAIIFNTAYAWKMHEDYDNMNKGKTSQSAGNVGSKFIEKHLKDDSNEMMEFYAAQMRKLK